MNLYEKIFGYIAYKQYPNIWHHSKFALSCNCSDCPNCGSKGCGGCEGRSTSGGGGGSSSSSSECCCVIL